MKETLYITMNGDVSEVAKMAHIIAQLKSEGWVVDDPHYTLHDSDGFPIRQTQLLYREFDIPEKNTDI